MISRCYNIQQSARCFYIHGSVHRNSILIRSNKIQQYSGIYLLRNCSTSFGCTSHPSTGVHKTVNAASGTGHSIEAKTFLQRGLSRSRRRKIQKFWLRNLADSAIRTIAHVANCLSLILNNIP